MHRMHLFWGTRPSLTSEGLCSPPYLLRCTLRQILRGKGPLPVVFNAPIPCVQLHKSRRRCCRARADGVEVPLQRLHILFPAQVNVKGRREGEALLSQQTAVRGAPTLCRDKGVLLGPAVGRTEVGHCPPKQGCRATPRHKLSKFHFTVSDDLTKVSEECLQAESLSR